MQILSFTSRDAPSATNIKHPCQSSPCCPKTSPMANGRRLPYSFNHKGRYYLLVYNAISSACTPSSIKSPQSHPFPNPKAPRTHHPVHIPQHHLHRQQPSLCLWKTMSSSSSTSTLSTPFPLPTYPGPTAS